MTVTEKIITIIVVIAGTQLTRWLPFWFFRSKGKTPDYINYLGRVLPPAIFGMLVIYCYKDVNFIGSHYGFKEIISSCIVVLVQLIF